MNFIPANAGVFLIYGVAWILLIVSFGTYWYRMENAIAFETSYFSFNKIKTVDDNDNYFPITFAEERLNERFLQILKISFAFSVLAWAILSLTLLFIFLSLAGILSKIPLPLPAITKVILPVITLGLCLLSMFIFFGTSNARYEDCREHFKDSACIKEEFTFVYDNSWGKGGPYTGWIVVVVSTFLVLVGGIISFLFANYDGTTPT
ncbi:hypothetical protein DFA_00307 [Cavenderia fasciculata]|uniref:Transmembrane protein n=1 Tax=Cavenderia fasciculata TaxID=261658 RepID=F4PY69_CACFS|nr:uncharacterized protein DFA_00307 [Cavenderia fasciculata]EGG19729.1 hypothetical protein DFA_00307 [Cavenderia fasciculata]|eukprot:XP_004358023.1 hypothetical protein DFA_00307 [Cavenderia fasciculata]